VRWAGLLAVALALAGCPDKAPPPPAPKPLVKPAPLPPLVAERRPAEDGGEDREAIFQVRPFTFTGTPAPASAIPLAVAGATAKQGDAAWPLEEPAAVAKFKASLSPEATVVLSADADTYLAQVLPLLAALDDSGAKLWLRSPDDPAVAWPVTLRDEAGFGAWIDEAVAGKLRVIQRADGFELQTNLGKLAGGDPNGPTVPTRGGKLDLVTLQKGLDRVKTRFPEAPDVCFAPSWGTTLADATRAVAANQVSAEQVVFAQVCLVYPRPKPPAAK
jgi:hypothetical protein